MVADIIIDNLITTRKDYLKLMGLDQSAEHESKPGHHHAKMFNRRHYPKLKEIWRDFSYLAARRRSIRESVGEEGLPPDFRERLMLAVTDVNRCRYCRTYHVQQAGLAGLTDSEIKAYLTDSVPREVPEEQRLAVSYARLWAESSTDPPREIRDQVRGEYADRMFQSIEIVLRMIWMGNLLGNSFDFLLYRISRGRWGGVNEFEQPDKLLMKSEEGQ